MKFYAFQFLVALACAALLIWRPWPGLPIVLIGGLIIVASCIFTYIGNKEAVDSMWWRIAFSVLAILLIGLAQS